MSVEEYKRARSVSRIDDGNDEEVVSKAELVDIIETEGRWGGRSIITLTADIHKARAEKERYQEYALVLRRLRDPDGKPQSTRLEIRSHLIQMAMQNVLGDYPTINMDSNPIVIEKPYAPLFHYRKELRDYAAHEDRTKEEKTHMDALIKFMEMYLQIVERASERLLPSELTSHNILWTLFRPEDVVIARRDYFTEAYVVDSCSVLEYMEEGQLRTRVTLVLRSWDYNGAHFGPVKEHLVLKDFRGSKKIYDLDVYPIKYHREPDGEDVRQKLINRGMKWRGIVDVTHREYDALSWTDPLTAEAETMAELVPVHTSGRIILDYSTHQQAKPQLATLLARGSATKATLNKPQGGGSVDAEVYDLSPENTEGSEAAKIKKSKYEDKYVSHPNNDTYVMTPAQALLCPARVRGFSLTDKIWSFFLVDEVKDIRWAQDSFAKLELEENFKKTINALVFTHGSSPKIHEQVDDIISGKGKGLIFLLTGPPGLGKTLTAESIAEKTHKPLYAITCGELGTDVVQTDRILRRIFARAKTWNAILLLDEADVFLAKRDRTDLQRNAFVSIFLRLIEYYQGILFLTTNRLDEFDDAFQSRIHLTVNYQPLTDVKRAAIWKNLLDQITPGHWAAEAVARLSREYNINGREIKNLIRTAAALAEHDGVRLSEEHIQTVFNLNTESNNNKTEKNTLKVLL